MNVVPGSSSCRLCRRGPSSARWTGCLGSPADVGPQGAFGCFREKMGLHRHKEVIEILRGSGDFKPCVYRSVVAADFMVEAAVHAGRVEDDN